MYMFEKETECLEGKYLGKGNVFRENIKNFERGNYRFKGGAVDMENI